MKVVVTGGSGQLGTAVLERLVAAPGVEHVVSLDLVPPIVPAGQIDFRLADLRDPGLERHLEGADALVHLAFIVAKRATPETMRAVNVEGTRTLFEAAARHGVTRIVYASSVAAYGIAPDHVVPVVESTSRRRTGVLTYADNKYDVEELLDAFEPLHPEISIARLRPGILLGRRIAHIGEALLRRRVLPVFSGARGPIVWDEDVADAVILALTRGARGAYNVVAEDPLGGTEVARLAGFRPVTVPGGVMAAATRASSALGRVTGQKRIDPGWLEAMRHDLIVSPAKARGELGWRPRYPTSADVAIAFGKAVRTGLDPRIRVFMAMAPRSARPGPVGDGAQGAGGPTRVHLDVTGQTGGDFTLTDDQGERRVTRGIPRPPDATVTLSVETLLELLAGHAEIAEALRVGTVKVRGEPVGGQILGDLIEAFRRGPEQEGVRGKVARGVARWFDRGPRK